ncbi:MAG: hypothetical protein AAF804_00095 [Bacteroidota bacterium]
MLRTIIAFAFILSNFHWASGQDLRVDARLSQQQVQIGEPISYILELSQQPNVRVTWPAIGDTLGGVDIIDKGTVDTLLQDGRLIQTQVLTLMAFDSGEYRLPSLTFQYLTPGRGDVREERTEAYRLSVETVPVDTTQAFKDIKGIQDEPITLEEVLLVGGMGLAGVALLVGVIWYIRRRRQQKPVIPVRTKPQVPPHEIAMRRLGELESQRLWQEGKVKEYYVEMTHILRWYLEQRYHIQALESVSYEIIRDLKGKSVPKRQIDDLERLLPLADLAKFAKSQPSEKDNLNAIETAREFIRATKSDPVQPQSEPSTPSAPRAEASANESV